MLSCLALHDKLYGIEKPFLEASKWFKEVESSQKFSLAIIKGPYGCGKTLLLDILRNNCTKQFLNIGHDFKITGSKEFADILSTLKGKLGKKISVIFVIEDIEERDDFQMLLDVLDNYSSEDSKYQFLATASHDFFIPKWKKLYGSTTMIRIEGRSTIHTKAIVEKVIGDLDTKHRIILSLSCDKEPYDFRFLLNNVKFYYETGRIRNIYTKDLVSNVDSFDECVDITSLKLQSNLPRIYDMFSLGSLYENDCLSEYIERVREKNITNKEKRYKPKAPKEEMKGVHLKKEYRDMRSNVRLEVFSSLEYIMETQLKLGQESDKITDLMNYIEESYIIGKFELEGIGISALSSRSVASRETLEPSAKRRKVLGDIFSFKFNEGTSVAVRKRVNYTFFKYICANKNI